MEVIEVVENPRRRRRLSRKQIAAGFGGKRKRSRRRRNPAMASYTTAENPRRRRSRVRSTYRRRSRRYRNPGGMLGGLGSMVNTNSLLWMSAGAVAVKMAPRFVKMVWPGMPTTGITGKAVQAGLAFGLSMLVRQFVGRKQAQDVLNGGLVITLVEVLNENVLPMIGLSDYVYLTPAEMQPLAGMSDYIYDTSVVPAGDNQFIGY